VSGDVTTQLARPTDDPATRAAAVRYLTRTGNADVLEVLGLVEAAPARRVAKCVVCGNKLPSHGVCRRARGCRDAAQVTS